MIFHRFGVLTIKYALKRERERERTSFDRRKKKKEKSTFESLVIGRRRDR